MGLDSVELVMEVESIFGIAIPDEEASRIVTVGDLYQCVLSKLPTEETRRCLSAATFFRFRRALIEGFGFDRRDVRPSTPLCRMIPDTNRRSEWQSLADRLGWRFPSLVRPTSINIILFLLFSIPIMVAVAAWWHVIEPPFASLPGLVERLFIGGIVGGMLATAAYQFTKPWATRFPRDCESIRGAVEATLRMNYGKISGECSGWNREEAWESLRALIARQLGVDPTRVIESAHFVEDFDID